MTARTSKLLLSLPVAIAIAFGTSQATRSHATDPKTERIAELRKLADAHPSFVRMRLDLAVEYLRSGAISDARTEAAIALASASTSGDRQRAQKYLGWATALDGDAKAGAALLEASAAANPHDADARWFLANARLALGDRAGALQLLSTLDTQQLDPQARKLVADVTTEARR